MPPHRADIRQPEGNVIELQHSPISPKEIQEREEFYGEMVWLLDGRDYDIRGLAGGATQFRWARARRSFLAAKRRVFADLVEVVLEVESFCVAPGYREWTGLGVTGRLHAKQDFLAMFSLRQLDEDERRTPIYFTATWRTERRELRHRNFSTREALDGWPRPATLEHVVAHYPDRVALVK